MSWSSTILFISTSAAFTFFVLSNNTLTNSENTKRRRRGAKGGEERRRRTISRTTTRKASSSRGTKRSPTATTTTASRRRNDFSSSLGHDEELNDSEEDDTHDHHEQQSGFYPLIVRARHRLSFDATTTIINQQNAVDDQGYDSITGMGHGHNTSSHHPSHHDHFQVSTTTGASTTASTDTFQQTKSQGTNNNITNMESFAHFQELMQTKDTSMSYKSSSSSNDNNNKIPNASCFACRDEFMEDENRKSTRAEKILHKQAGHSFNSTSTTSLFDDKDDDEEDDDNGRNNSISSTGEHNMKKKIYTKTRQTKPNPSSEENIHPSRFSVWRSTYNSKIMPNRVILVRHGQSEGNVNEAIYAEKPDSEISLTKLGWEQAKMAGRALKQEILQQQQQQQQQSHGKDEEDSSKKPVSVHFIVSPYVRTMETFHGLVSAWCDPDVEFANWNNEGQEHERKMLWYSRLREMGITWHEDPRIREQDFGNYQRQHIIDKAKMERHKFGAFYYRFPNGESASDVYDRASTFLDSLWRSFDANRSQNYVLVTHGISVRVLLMRYFRYSIDQFYMVANPRNCEMIILGHDGKGRLQLNGRCDLELREKTTAPFITKDNGDDDDDTNHNNRDVDETEQNSPVKDAPAHEMDMASEMIQVHGYKFYKRLRIVPDHHMRTRVIRLSYRG